jgi:hypothetical protein
MNRKLLLVFLFVIMMSLSCDWLFGPGHCDATGPVVVYKTKQDYSNNVTIQLSKDNSKITCYPGPADAANLRPVKLANGYLLQRMCGDAVLSITIDEYSSSTRSYSIAELYSMIIDTDPYLEKYECCECAGRDTAKINDLIRKNLLNKCERIK